MDKKIISEIASTLTEKFGEPIMDENVLNQVAPPGMEDVVKRLKQDKNVKNPWATAWSIYNKKNKR
jgi:hypothetical protein